MAGNYNTNAFVVSTHRAPHTNNNNTNNNSSNRKRRQQAKLYNGVVGGGIKHYVLPTPIPKTIKTTGPVAAKACRLCEPAEDLLVGHIPVCSPIHKEAAGRGKAPFRGMETTITSYGMQANHFCIAKQPLCSPAFPHLPCGGIHPDNLTWIHDGGWINRKKIRVEPHRNGRGRRVHFKAIILDLAGIAQLLLDGGWFGHCSKLAFPSCVETSCQSHCVPRGCIHFHHLGKLLPQ